MREKTKALRAAVPYTLPVFTGFSVLGIAYGILMHSKGYSFIGIALISLLVYAGSMQFVAVGLLSIGFNPLYTVLITMMVNARHLFYGVSMLDKFKGSEKMKPYLIFGLADETFSILCSTEPPQDVDKNWFMFFVTMLNHFYWVLGSMIGGILGTMISFNTKGIDFVLTALFVVIFMNQWKSTKNHLPVMIGVGSSLICRIVFGAAHFIIPSMAIILLLVTLCKNTIEERNT